MIPYTYAADRKNLQSYAIEMYEKKFSRKKLNKKNHSLQPKEQKQAINEVTKSIKTPTKGKPAT